jgi:putative colanic acid biosynthesis acetyltransferase WcaF
VARAAWQVVWVALFRPSPTLLWGWRRLLLRLFGARVHPTAHVYPSVKVWAPWNLSMDEFACLGRDVDVYSVAPVALGKRTTVSQYGYLCAAGHDHERSDYPLTPAPITLGDDVWLGADVFVAPGVTIATGVVVGARASVFKDLPAWTVCVGSPAQPARERVLEGRSPGAGTPR